MEDSLTILALAGGGKVERVDWSLVLANFANEPATTAHKAGPHVLGAKLQGGLQGCHELSPVQLLHVLDAVGVSGRVEILPRPHSFCQCNFNSLSLSSRAGGEVGHKVDQLLPQPARLLQHWGDFGKGRIEGRDIDDGFAGHVGKKGGRGGCNGPGWGGGLIVSKHNLSFFLGHIRASPWCYVPVVEKP